MIERKAAGEGIADVDKKNRTIVGYASTFGNKDRHNDIVVAGAFKRTLNNNPNKVKVFMHHDPVLLVGRPKVMNEDQKGLYTESIISDTASGRDLLTLVEDGVLTDLSIGFKTVKDDWNEDRSTRFIKEAQLFEYSFVSIPANPEANITGVKSFTELQSILTSMQRFEKALRDGDFETNEIPERIEFIVKTWREQLDSVFYEIGELKATEQEVTPDTDLVDSELDAQNEFDLSAVTNIKELRSLLTKADSIEESVTLNGEDSASQSDSPDGTQNEDEDLLKTLSSRAAKIEMAAALKFMGRKIKEKHNG